MLYKILAINPGSNTTKIAIFHNIKPVFLRTLDHNKKDLDSFLKVSDQLDYRKKAILNEIKSSNINLDEIQIVMARGGLLKPIISGVYRINDLMQKDLKEAVQGEHASNLGALLAKEIVKNIVGTEAFIADPVVVDEMQDVARVSGHKLFKRKSVFHALNHKATSRMYAKLLNRQYEDLNLIVAHLGSGFSIAAHKNGKVIDVNQALDGEGPFSPERSGTLPVGAFARYCVENKLNKDDIFKITSREGGVISYLHTNNAYEIEIRASEGDKQARFIQDAMAYQIAKEIGAMAAVLNGEVDAIILTGGVSNNTMIVEYIKKMVNFLGPVVIYPGEDEMHALAMNGLMLLKGEIKPKDYIKKYFVNTDIPV